jgi:NitT/TauT family transport system substrate-binding protein
MFKSLIPLCLLALSTAATAETAPNIIRVGALAFGTLNWELAVIKSQKLDTAHQIRIETTELASPEAGRIGLQGNSIDIMVSDWIWVARQRSQGQDYTFVPFSSSHGALMVAKESPIHDIADLADKRLGVAGGGMDKNWLLLKAVAQKTAALDLEQKSTVTFGAPPLLNQSLVQGQLDALLTYWNYAAMLEAQGYRQILDGRGIQVALGIKTDVPALGYVFRESWAKAHPNAVDGFMKATTEARKQICESDSVWKDISSLTEEKDTQVQSALRKHYCDGRIIAFGEKEIQSAQQIFGRIEPLGEHPAGGDIQTLPNGVFWSKASH